MTTRLEDESAIRTLIDEWAAAVRRRDYDGILARHSPNILMFDVPPPYQSKGLDAYRRSWDLFYSWMTEPVVFNFSDVAVTAGTDVAFCDGTRALRSARERRIDHAARFPSDHGAAEDRRRMDRRTRTSFAAR